MTMGRWMDKQAQLGFGLLELVVVLLIGSLVVMLAVTMYGTGIKQLGNAHNSATWIDTDLHGVQALSAQLRMAGHGMHDAMPSAVVVHPQQVAQLRHQAGVISDKLLSKQAIGASGQGVAMASDQLVIWYVAPMDMWDCEGNAVLGARRARLQDGTMATVAGQVVIERYFVNSEDDGSLSLRCDSARFVTDDIQRDGTRDRRGIGSALMNAIIDAQVGKSGVSSANTVQGFGGSGEILIANIDGFWVRFLINHDDNIRQLSIRDYQALPAYPQVAGFELAILAKAPVATQSATQTAMQSFKLFGETVRITDNQPRRLYQTTILLPNTTADGLAVSSVVLGRAQ